MDRRSRLKLVRRIPRRNLLRDDEKDKFNQLTISQLVYNSARGELFFVDDLEDQHPLVKINLRNNDRVCDAFYDSVSSACHLSDVDLLCHRVFGGNAWR